MANERLFNSQNDFCIPKSRNKKRKEEKYIYQQVPSIHKPTNPQTDERPLPPTHDSALRVNQSEATKIIIDRVAPRGRIPFDRRHEDTAAIPGAVSVDLLIAQEGAAVEPDAVVAARRNDAGVVRDVAELDYAAAAAV